MMKTRFIIHFVISLYVLHKIQNHYVTDIIPHNTLEHTVVWIPNNVGIVGTSIKLRILSFKL